MLSETSDFRDPHTLLVMIRIGLLNERQTLFCRSLSLFLFFLPNTKRKKTQNNQIQRITACSIQQATHSKNCGFFGKL